MSGLLAKGAHFEKSYFQAAFFVVWSLLPGAPILTNLTFHTSLQWEVSPARGANFQRSIFDVFGFVFVKRTLC